MKKYNFYQARVTGQANILKTKNSRNRQDFKPRNG